VRGKHSLQRRRDLLAIAAIERGHQLEVARCRSGRRIAIRLQLRDDLDRPVVRLHALLIERNQVQNR